MGIFGWSFSFRFLVASLGPALVLLKYVYALDRGDKESRSLLFSLVLRGVLAAFLAIVLESVAFAFISNVQEPYHLVLLAFVGVALMEEGAKFLMLKKRTWSEREFDYTYDGVLYAVSVSLGFAMFENMKYVLIYGLSIAPSRALVSIPGHMSFAVYMGIYYAKAKQFQLRGQPARCKNALFLAVFVPTVLHGVFDYALMKNSGLSFLVFLLFVAVLFLRVRKLLKRESERDRRIL